MRICVMVETQENVDWPTWLAAANACEEAGISTLFASDHYLPVRAEEDSPVLDAWSVIAALSARTERLRFGTLVTPVTFRHPAALAKVVATAQHISGGRVEVGLGSGWHEPEHRALGLPFPSTRERMSMLAEQLPVLRGFWSERAEPFRGEHYRTEAVTLRPLARPHVLVGGEGGPRTIRLAARWADEYNTIRATVDQCRERAEKVRAAWAEEGRDPDTARLSLMTTCVAGRDEREVADRLAAVLDRFGGADPEAYRAKLRREAIIGTTEQIGEQLAALGEAGVDRVMLRHMLPADLDMFALLGKLAS